MTKWWTARSEISATLFEGRNRPPFIFLRYFFAIRNIVHSNFFSIKRRIKLRFLSTKVVRSLFRICRFMSEMSKTVPIPAPSTRNRHWLQVDYYSSPFLIPKKGNLSSFWEYSFAFGQIVFLKEFISSTLDIRGFRAILS